jgi:hypothetical protein
VGKLAFRVALIVDAEQRGEFAHVVLLAAEQRPAGGGELLLRPIGFQRLHRVALDVEAHQQEIHLVAEVLRQRLFDGFHVLDDDRAGVFAGGEEHRHDLRAAAQHAEFHVLADVGGPGGFELIERFVGQRGGGCGFAAAGWLFSGADEAGG